MTASTIPPLSVWPCGTPWLAQGGSGGLFDSPLIRLSVIRLSGFQCILPWTLLSLDSFIWLFCWTILLDSFSWIIVLGSFIGLCNWLEQRTNTHQRREKSSSTLHIGLLQPLCTDQVHQHAPYSKLPAGAKATEMTPFHSSSSPSRFIPLSLSLSSPSVSHRSRVHKVILHKTDSVEGFRF